MNRTTGRVLCTELLRGTAPPAALAFVAASAAMLRPRWQPVVVSWAAVTLGMVAGLLLAWGAAAAVIAPVASHHNGAWMLTLAVAVAGIAAAAALGVVMARLVRSRLVAPVAALAVYIAAAVFSYEDGWRGVMLVPSLGYAGTGTSSLASGLQLRQLLWFGALTATLLVLGATRRWWLAAVPGVLAAVLAASVVGWPADERRVPDAAAAGVLYEDDVVAGGDHPPPALALLERPEAEQRTWMGRYLAAARDCDTAALTDLVWELR